METTLTMAGQQAVAGAARLRVAPAGPAFGTIAAAGYTAAPAHQVSTGHPTTWIKGLFAASTTSMVLGRKNRPTRLLPERSP